MSKKAGWSIFFAVLFAPALTTMLVALADSGNLTSTWVLISSPVAGIASAILFARLCVREAGLRVALSLAFSFIFTGFCLISSFFGCAAAGGGGIRIGG